MGVIAWTALGLLAAGLAAGERPGGRDAALAVDARPGRLSPVALWPATSQLARLTGRILWDPALRHRCRDWRRP